MVSGWRTGVIEGQEHRLKFGLFRPGYNIKGLLPVFYALLNVYATDYAPERP